VKPSANQQIMTAYDTDARIQIKLRTSQSYAKAEMPSFAYILWLITLALNTGGSFPFTP